MPPVPAISSWDKALYYFGVKYNDYDHVWLIEDDVFHRVESGASGLYFVCVFDGKRYE